MAEFHAAVEQKLRPSKFTNCGDCKFSKKVFGYINFSSIYLLNIILFQYFTYDVTYDICGFMGHLQPTHIIYYTNTYAKSRKIIYNPHTLKEFVSKSLGICTITLNTYYCIKIALDFSILNLNGCLS